MLCKQFLQACLTSGSCAGFLYVRLITDKTENMPTNEPKHVHKHFFLSVVIHRLFSCLEMCRDSQWCPAQCSLCTWNNFPCGWLAGVVTCGPVQATLFCSHWESQDFFSVNTQNEFEVYRNILADFTLKRISKNMKWVIVLTYLIYDSCFWKSNLDEKPQAVLMLRIRFGEGCCWKAQISAETPTVS